MILVSLLIQMVCLKNCGNSVHTLFKKGIKVIEVSRLEDIIDIDYKAVKSRQNSHTEQKLTN